MKYITRTELFKLSALCESRKKEMEHLLTLSPDIENTQACKIIRSEVEYMKHLIDKLDGIAKSDARRIEITW